jgi:Uma2 family endonuclease
MTTLATPATPKPPPEIRGRRIGLESAGLPMTPAEYDAIEDWDENYRYELIHGVLIVTPPPSIEERSPSDMLCYWLNDYKHRHPQGSALDDTAPEHDVRTHDSRRRADRVIWAGLGRQPDHAEDLPTIVVEFVSVGRRDYYRDFIEKRQEYLALEIQEYWIIDRFRRTMTVYRGKPDDPQEQVLKEKDTYRTKLLPGFELSIAKVLAAADKWKKRKATTKKKKNK